MFKSKRRPIIIPQSEHARLAGIMAHLWGNENFDKPALKFSDFVLGVALHDRVYAEYDNLAINEVPEEDWLGAQENGILMTCDNPVIDLMSLLHSRRLLSFSEYAGTEALIELANEEIERNIIRTDHTLAEFEWADRIIRVCDSVAYIFSFEMAMKMSLPVSPRVGSEETVTIDIVVDESGIIQISPWTFRVESIEGYILGYEMEGYPERLEAVYMPFSLVK